jgi:hypothetical protein
MKLCDATTNPILSTTTCHTFGIFEGIALGVSLLSAGIGAMGQMAAGQQQAAAYEAQAAAQRQQAETAQQIANYNADIQRQNAEVSFKLAEYQAAAEASTAQFNQQTALVNQRQAILARQTAEQNRQAQLMNQEFANQQAEGARKAYEQGLSNAEAQRRYADTIRAQGQEEARRKREESDQRIATMRAKYAGSGVTFEGSPIVVLGDAARLAETNVQDIVYASELERQKQLRIGELTEFEAGFSLLDERGFKIQALNYLGAAETAEREKAALGLEAYNYKNAQLQEMYKEDLTVFDTAIAGARQEIANRQATLTELAGGVQAYGFQAEADVSMAKAAEARTTASYGAMGSLIGGVGSVFSSPMFTTQPKTVAGSPGSYSSSMVSGPGYSSYYGTIG